MHKRIAVLALLAASALAACGGGGSTGGRYSPPSGGGGGGPTAMPSIAPLSVGVALPSSGIGSVVDPTYGEVGGYTQNTYSQALAFPVGSTITVNNLSSIPHTLNVVSTTGFPANPALSTTASGGATIGASYASGNINPGSSVQILLAAAGIYYFGCAYHYLVAPQMRDVINVSNTAVPGVQATPQAGATAPPGGGGCTGYYC